MATINDLANALTDLKVSQESIIARLKETRAAERSAAQEQADKDAKVIDQAEQISELKSHLSVTFAQP